MMLQPSRSLPLLAIAAICLTVGIAGPVAAQSAANGKSLFESYCRSCHVTPQPAARDASAIRTAIQANRGPGMIAMAFLSDAQLADIAAYVANPAAATTPTASTADRILNWAETRYASILQGRETNVSFSGYTYRCYQTPRLCVGVGDSQVVLYYLDRPELGIQNYAPVTEVLQLAGQDGF